MEEHHTSHGMKVKQFLKDEKTQLVTTWTLTSSENNLTLQRLSIHWINKLQPTQSCTHQFSGPLCNIWLLLWNHFLQCCLREKKKEKTNWNKIEINISTATASFVLLLDTYMRSHWLFLRCTKTRIQNCSLIALTEGPPTIEVKPTVNSIHGRNLTYSNIRKKKKPNHILFLSLQHSWRGLWGLKGKPAIAGQLSHPVIDPAVFVSHSIGWPS